MTNVELVQSELQALKESQEALMRKPRIAKYLKTVNEWVQKTQNRDMSVYEQRNTAQVLYNAIIDTGLKAGTKLFEATTEDSIEFLGIQLPVIAALLPSLALNDLAVVQALDRRVGAVFYLDVKYGSDKGYVESGQTMIGAKSGHYVGKSGRRYAMARVVDESIGTSSDGLLSGTVEYGGTGCLINLDNVKVELVSNINTINESRTLLGSSNASGTITGTYASGSIDTAGAYSITTLGGNTGEIVYITYDYQYDMPVDNDNNRKGVPEVDVSVTQETITAIDFPLRAKYSIGAQIDLQKAHGLNLESELVKYLGNEVKFTIDQVGLDMIDDAAASDDAADAPTTWDAQVQSGQEWLWKKHEITDCKKSVPLYSNVCRKAA